MLLYTQSTDPSLRAHIYIYIIRVIYLYMYIYAYGLRYRAYSTQVFPQPICTPTGNGRHRPVCLGLSHHSNYTHIAWHRAYSSLVPTLTICTLLALVVSDPRAHPIHSQMAGISNHSCCTAFGRAPPGTPCVHPQPVVFSPRTYVNFLRGGRHNRESLDIVGARFRAGIPPSLVHLYPAMS